MMQALSSAILFLSILLTLVLAGWVYQIIGTARDSAKFPPPGQIIDVGGHGLHIWCMGDGSPAILFDSPLGASCLSLALVQPSVASFARACSYDRAGFGWSDAGPMPRTARRVANELHALLVCTR